MNIKSIVVIILFSLITLFILFNKPDKEHFQNNDYAPFISYENEISSGIQNIDYTYIKGATGPKGDPGKNPGDQHIVSYLDSLYNYQEPLTATEVLANTIDEQNRIIEEQNGIIDEANARKTVSVSGLDGAVAKLYEANAIKQTAEIAKAEAEATSATALTAKTAAIAGRDKAIKDYASHKAVKDSNYNMYMHYAGVATTANNKINDLDKQRNVPDWAGGPDYFGQLHIDKLIDEQVTIRSNNRNWSNMYRATGSWTTKMNAENVKKLDYIAKIATQDAIITAQNGIITTQNGIIDEQNVIIETQTSIKNNYEDNIATEDEIIATAEGIKQTAEEEKQVAIDLQKAAAEIAAEISAAAAAPA